MKIKALEIYGYGKLENIKIDSFSPGIQVIYGRNEAGKSTLMAFIHAILFGFPTKNQTELRYEPKKGFKYGGKLHIETHDRSTLTIERIAGKAVGDVSVLDKEGNEYPLEQVLAGLDKSIYKGIFSFNIMDMQNLKLIDVEQLGGYLFSSGLIGTDKLQRISDQLVKSLDEQFKPSGRKPIINKLLTDLREEEKEVQKWKQKLEHYETLQKDIQKSEERLRVIDIEKEKLSLELRQIEAMLVMQPIQDQLVQIQAELTTLGDYPRFPTDGIARLEKLLTEQTIYHSKLEKLDQDKALLEGKIERIEINNDLLSLEERIEGLSTNLHKHQQATEQIGLLGAEKQRCIKQIQVWTTELSWDGYTEKQIVEIDTSLAARAQLKEVLQTQQKLSLQKQRLDEHFQQAKDDLEQHEEQITSLEKEQQPSELLQRVRKEIKEQSTDQLEREITIHEQLLLQMDKQLAHHQADLTNSMKKRKLVAGTSVVIGSVGSIGLYMQDLLLFALLCFFLSATIGAFLLFSNNQSSILARLEQEKAGLKVKLASLKEKLYESPYRTNKEANQLLLAKEEQIQQLLQKERLLLAQSERAYDRIIRQYEEWEKEHFTLEEKIVDWMKLRRLQSIPISHLEEAFDRAVQIKNGISEKLSLVAKIQMYQAIVEQFEIEINKLLAIVSFSTTSIEEAFYYLKGQLQENKKLQHLRNELELKIIAIDEEAKLLSIQWNEVNKQVNSLMKQAHASSEEDFRVKHQLYQKATILEQKQTLVNSQLLQLEKSFGFPLVKGRTNAIWERDKAELEKELTELKEEKSLLYQLKTRNVETVRSLEEEGTYSDAIQQLELSKGKLQEYARKWAVLSTAQQLLAKTMDFYRSVKLPEVLDKASQYFSFLTKEEYVQVYDSNLETKLMVKHKNGLTFEPKELSQATIEQLYLALRFAVASVWSKQQRFPFMMDDTFVNFDQERTYQAISLMRKLTEEGEQLLFFTCHKHMKHLFEKEGNVSVYNMEHAHVPHSV
ncbi:ATP-binding protein [Sutcliffiella halmapala]|uniref:ATP-binding protein n=1 Tax=Sutcliffiella halmapala TaxID=79882 RepID=UPI000995941F|nr:AAA family ATPase [Sutcliffiella halmapala]